MELTLIIPVYNVEKYLSECLDSILLQDFQGKYEVVCVDDGSTDRSLQILYEYQKRFKHFHILTQSNKGPSSARNVGLNHASGEYILFLDSDDFLFNRSTLSNLYKEIVNKDIDFLLGGFRFYYDKSTIHKDIHYKENIKNQIFSGNELFELLIKENVYLSVMCNKLYRKSFLDKNKLDFIEGVFFEDVEFMTKCFFSASKVKVVDYIIFNYRQRENSIMNNSLHFSELYKNYLLVAESLFLINRQYNSQAITQLILFLYVILLKNIKKLDKEDSRQIIESIKSNNVMMMFLKYPKFKYKIFGIISLYKIL